MWYTWLLPNRYQVDSDMTITLKKLKYFEHTGDPREWTLDTLSLRQVNLIVGKNATGKSRAIDLIGKLAAALLQKQKLAVAGYEVTFDSDGTELRYELQITENVVQKEILTVGNEEVLSRDGSGATIFVTEQKERMRIRPPSDELVAVSRRDELQHPFLTPLHTWAAGVRHYHFGDRLGKTQLVVFVENAPEVDDREESQVVSIFLKGQRTFGQRFVDSVVADMRALRYSVTDLGIHPLGTVVDPLKRAVHGLAVKEDGINGRVDQANMSQGMFRALSILVQVTYSQMAERANCILIDDIGEGLDFDRSSLLIEMLRNKTIHSNCQLVMTTNDRFVMNRVPLEEWSVLQRSGCHVIVKNSENSKEQFEEFKFVGLSNFSFFEMDFVNGEPEEVDVAT